MKGSTDPPSRSDEEDGRTPRNEVHLRPGSLRVTRLGVRPRGTVEARFAAEVVPEIEVLLRVAQTFTCHAADAEDLVQDTLLRAFRSIDTFDGRHPRAWLLTILRNTNTNTNSNRHRRRRPDLLDDPDQEIAVPGGVETTPEGIVVGSMFDAAVEAGLRRLSGDFRRTIELVDIAGLSYAETAGLLDVPVGTVMSRLHRARTRLREHLTAADLTEGSP